jgi:hypothetical protein
MQNKTILLATFTKSNFIDSVLDRLSTKFNIEEKDIFFFETEYDDILMTYRMEMEGGKRFDIRKDLRKTIQVHKKGPTFFTINALNKLIERDNDLEFGNVDYSQYSVDWGKYRNNLILLQKGELDIVAIAKYERPN